MIAVTSCWHLAGDHLEDRLYWIDRALEQMHHSGVRAVLHCGDLFNYARIGTKDAPAPVIIEGLKRVLTRWRLPIFAAVGNHDQVEGHDSSAVRALDGLPYFAHMGGLPNFELPVEGFEEVSFVAVDWEPRMDNAEWAMRLGSRVGYGKRTVVFGHADLPEVSQLDLPNSRWPRPTYRELELIREWAPESDRVLFFFGHNHSGSEGWSGEHGTFVRGVPALTRLRWDEADHVDGWLKIEPLHDGSMMVSHQPLHGPEFIDLTDGTQSGWGWELKPRFSRVRTPLPAVDVDWVDKARANNILVEVVPFTEKRARAQVKESSVEFGQGPLPALYAWGKDQGVDVEQAGSLLSRMFLEDGSLEVNTRPTSVSSVDWVRLDRHVAFPGSRSVEFKPGLNVLLGPTGCGKSSLLESAYAALYGAWPSTYRKGSFWAPFLEGGSVEAAVTLTSGKKLGVQRGRSGETPYLEAHVDGRLLVNYTQPKKVQPAISSMVDDPDLWLRSSFLTQDHDPDMVESSPEDRLRAFNRVLGLEELAAVRSRVADRLKQMAAHVAARDVRARAVEDRRSALAEEEKELFGFEVQFKSAQEEVDQGAARAAKILEDRKLVGVLKEAEHLRAIVAQNIPEYDYEGIVAWSRESCEKAEDAKRVFGKLLDDSKQVDLGDMARKKLACVGCADNPLPCPLINDAVEALRRSEDLVAEGFSQDKVRQAEAQFESAEKAYASAYQSHMQANQVLDRVEAATKRLAVLEEHNDLTGAAEETEEDLQFLWDYQAAVSRRDQAAGSIPVVRRAIEKNLAYLEQELEGLTVTETALGDLEPLRVLERAFSRSGIQRLMLEQGLPAIQAELNALTEREGLRDLRIELDYPTDSDDPRAAPSVLVSVAGGPWSDAKPRSGGQRALVRLLVRLACCLWTAKATGRAGVLVLDEPTGGVSEAYVDAVAELLRDLVGPGCLFTQGILSTHDEVLAQALGGNVVRP